MNSKSPLSSESIISISDLSRKYKNARPFPHVFIDNFLENNSADYIYNNFPTMEKMPNIFKEPMSYKGQLSDIDGKWPIFSKLFNYLQSKDFREYLSRLTGIPDLLPDPILAGGGLHQSPKSGFLDIHVDANFHPLDKSMHRRINLIIYFNKNWNKDWGGNLELWSDRENKPDEMISYIEPIFNRAAIFSTTRTSWHGVSPVNCPSNESRKSIALYYYTKSRPSSELYEDTSVIWMNKSNKLKIIFYPILNFMIKILKPYAKYIRRNVFDAASKGQKK